MRIFVLAYAAILCGPACQGQPRDQQWWHREPLRILDLHTFSEQIDYWPAAEAARRKAALLFNTDALYVNILKNGFDDRGFYYRSSVASVSHPDYLAPALAEARRGGMRTVVYFNVHWYTNRFGNEHPDWRQIRENGQVVGGVYDSGTDFCVNSPWREWVFQALGDMAAYDIDGVFLDGPIFRQDTCYCRHCRERFRAAYGRDLPSKQQRTGPAARQLLDFQAESLARFVGDSNRVLKQKRPSIALFMNGGALGGNWATARMNRVLVREQDFLASEGGFIYNDLTRIPLWKPGLRARLLETQAGGKPSVVIAGAGLKPWTHATLPDPEIRLLYADSVANGAGVWLSLTLTQMEQPATVACVTAMNRFLADNAAYYRDTRSEARVAVLWSDTTANFYSPDAQLIDIDTVQSRTEAGNLEREFLGIAETLLRAHVPFDVIDDETVESGSLGRYRAVFLPNVACMSNRAAERLRNYVRGGGGLFATFETSLYDEYGQRRKDLALADLLGVTLAGKRAGPRRYDFMQAVAEDPLVAGVPRPVALSPAYYARVRPAGATTLIRYAEPRTGPYESITGLTPDAALTSHAFGAGTAVYVTGDIGNTIANFHVPDALAIVENAAAKLAPAGVRLENAPGSVELVHRSQKGGRHLLHLVNFTGEMTRPIQRILPVTGAHLTLPPDWPVRGAKALVNGKPLSIVRTPRGEARIALPGIQEYEVIVVETGASR